MWFGQAQGSRGHCRQQERDGELRPPQVPTGQKAQPSSQPHSSALCQAEWINTQGQKPPGAEEKHGSSPFVPGGELKANFNSQNVIPNITAQMYVIYSALHKLQVFFQIGTSSPVIGNQDI